MIDYTDIMRDKSAYLSMQEIDTLLQTAYETGNIRDYMLILTLARTGRRITEVVGQRPYTRMVGLRPCDLHEDDLIEWDILKKRPVRKRDRKGRLIKKDDLNTARQNKMPKRKLKPVDHTFMHLLKSYIKHKQIGPYTRIFPITRQRAHYIISHVAQKAGIARSKHKIGPHMFRHGLAVNYLKANSHNPRALLDIRELLDHSDINVTMAYWQFTPEDTREGLTSLFQTEP